MSEFIIVGDTAMYQECLVRLAGADYERAKEILEEVKREGKEGHTNFKIKEVADKDCWWNDPFLCN